MTDDELLSVLLEGNSDQIQRSLRDRGPNSVIDGRPLIHWVVSIRDERALSTLLAMGADANGRTESGETALISAAYMGGLNLVRILLSAGADVGATDSEGQSALMAAAKAGHLPIATALVEAGADVAHVDARGRSALHWSIVESDNNDVVEYLVAKGAPKNLVSTDGHTAHEYAVQLWRPRSAKLLLPSAE